MADGHYNRHLSSKKKKDFVLLKTEHSEKTKVLSSTTYSKYFEKTELKSRDDPDEPRRPGTTQESDEDIYIVVSGKLSNGKSTALNNIFGLNIPTGMDPDMGPRSVTTRYIEQTVSKCGIRLHVIETPSLGTRDTDKMYEFIRMARDIRDKSCIFLYCLSVAPGNPINESDESIIKALHLSFNKSIWKESVFLFTFSDCAKTSGSTVKAYKQHIEEYKKAFHVLLQQEGANITKFMTVFDYADETDRQRDTNLGTVAVPVCDVVAPEQHDILPGVLKGGDDWTDIVFDEIMKKVDGRKRRAHYFRLKYAHDIKSAVEPTFPCNIPLSDIISLRRGRQGHQ